MQKAERNFYRDVKSAGKSQPYHRSGNIEGFRRGMSIKCIFSVKLEANAISDKWFIFLSSEYTFIKLFTN